MENQKTDIPQYFNSFPTDKKKVIAEFKKGIHQNVFFNNLQILQENSDYILFNFEKWHMRPEVFCADQYSEPYFYQVILLVNNIKSIFEFIPDKFVDRTIVAPYRHQIISLLSFSNY
jgi:hypothetical protein